MINLFQEGAGNWLEMNFMYFNIHAVQNLTELCFFGSASVSALYPTKSHNFMLNIWNFGRTQGSYLGLSEICWKRLWGHFGVGLEVNFRAFWSQILGYPWNYVVDTLGSICAKTGDQIGGTIGSLWGYPKGHFGVTSGVLLDHLWGTTWSLLRVH